MSQAYGSDEPDPQAEPLLFHWIEIAVGAMGVFVPDRADLIAHAPAMRAWA